MLNSRIVINRHLESVGVVDAVAVACWEEPSEAGALPQEEEVGVEYLTEAGVINGTVPERLALCLQMWDFSK